VQEDRDSVLCVLGIPADMSVASFCKFCGAYLQHIQEMRVLRRETAQKSVYMVVMRFNAQELADSFFKEFDGKPVSGDHTLVFFLVHSPLINSIRVLHKYCANVLDSLQSNVL
jgi:DNA-binding protein Fis